MKNKDLLELEYKRNGLEAEISMIENALSNRNNSWCIDLLSAALIDRKEQLAAVNLDILSFREDKV